MRFEAARAEGERVVGELLRKLRQDTGNAKWIGRMALSKIEERVSRNGDQESSKSEPSTAASGVPSADEVPGSPNLITPAETLSAWSILSASELIDYLATCSEEDARRILDEERLKLDRASVIAAALRRLG